LTTDWIAALGGTASYEQVKRQFMKFYWGQHANGGSGTAKVTGNVLRERWLVPVAQLRAWRQRVELALFTGRTRRELDFTLARAHAQNLFSQVVTMDDVPRLKPHPDGLLRILDGRDPQRALYLGDNLDDALSAQRAGVPFVGVLRRNSRERRLRGAALRAAGALAIVHSAREIASWL
jgi:phosphoglycolate phosphatase-like HAD superfamily hydrolase